VTRPQLSYLVFGAALLLAAGCSKSPEKRLIGKWTGTPNVAEAVDQGVDAAAQGKTVNPLARGAARFMGQKLAEATMSVEVDFRAGGIVFFRGNTDVLGLPPDSDGTWEIISAFSDKLEIRLGTSAKQLHGQILMRDKNEFTLKLDPPAEAPPKEGEKPAAPPPTSLIFKRGAN
jgi:hypothetical protein